MSLDGIALFRGDVKTALREATGGEPTLLVLLRHSGCPLCREHLVVTEGMLNEIPAGRCKVVGICQGEGGDALSLEQELELSFPVYANPDASLYRELSLPRGSWWQVTLGPMLRHPLKAVRRMSDVRRPGKDVRQLGGVVLLSSDLKVLYRYAQRDSGDLPGDDKVLAAINQFCN
ncbi:hypothetical protein FHR99_000512 [Litorivivens lipolytica]|uniref:AhpC/TSA family protein n=1 Tax=Litorivivens lipolytica TaxID=1524264 RepID=A0A7W4Z5U7_9GAMM|nr:AhpC/TSA family protein [Litorivivens lipolytica]MBB3046276.1 hypothetical protein [Litorivivens lipolytica]